MNNFVALDVETANQDYSSICQIGLAYFENGELVETWKAYVNPQTNFSYRNMKIHGIRPETVAGSMSLVDFAEQLRPKLTNRIVVHHTHFDRSAIGQLFGNLDLDPIDCHWLDTTEVVREVFPQFRQNGYGLEPLTQYFSITFNHHDACEDAIATGKVLIKTLERNNSKLEEWEQFYYPFRCIYPSIDLQNNKIPSATKTYLVGITKKTADGKVRRTLIKHFVSKGDRLDLRIEKYDKYSATISAYTLPEKDTKNQQAHSIGEIPYTESHDLAKLIHKGYAIECYVADLEIRKSSLDLWVRLKILPPPADFIPQLPDIDEEDEDQEVFKEDGLIVDTIQNKPFENTKVKEQTAIDKILYGDKKANSINKFLSKYIHAKYPLFVTVTIVLITMLICVSYTISTITTGIAGIHATRTARHQTPQSVITLIP